MLGRTLFIIRVDVKAIKINVSSLDSVTTSYKRKGKLLPSPDKDVHRLLPIALKIEMKICPTSADHPGSALV